MNLLGTRRRAAILILIVFVFVFVWECLLRIASFNKQTVRCCSFINLAANMTFGSKFWRLIETTTTTTLASKWSHLSNVVGLKRRTFRVYLQDINFKRFVRSNMKNWIKNGRLDQVETAKEEEKEEDTSMLQVALHYIAQTKPLVFLYEMPSWSVEINFVCLLVLVCTVSLCIVCVRVYC